MGQVRRKGGKTDPGDFWQRQLVAVVTGEPQEGHGRHQAGQFTESELVVGSEFKA